MKKLLLIIILLLAAATPLLATPTQGTCGDNICRADTGEDKLTCPQDCGKLPPSELIFERVWTNPVPISNTQGGIQVSANFYYYNTTKLIHGNELDAAQHIDDAKCMVELNNNTFEMTNYYSDIKYTVNININEGQYSGILKCISSLGNRSWPVQFSRVGNSYYSQTISPEKINEHSIQEINNSAYRDYVNLTQIQQEQQKKDANKPPSFADTMSKLMGLAILVIALFAYTVLSIVYAVARTIKYIFNIGKGAKPPIAAIAILLTCALAIAFLPLLILIPVIMTLKIIHKAITLILPKQKTQTTKNKIKIEEI